MRLDHRGLIFVSILILMILSAVAGCGHLKNKANGDRPVAIEKIGSTHVYFQSATVSEEDGDLRVTGRVKRKGHFHVSSGYVLVTAFDAGSNIVAQKPVTHVPKDLSLRRGRRSSGFTAGLAVRPEKVARVEVRYIEGSALLQPSAAAGGGDRNNAGIPALMNSLSRLMF